MANTFNLGNGNWAQKTEKLLAYNAENDNYKPLPFDFDRASTATRVNRQGLIETVSVDEPRIDFLNNSKGHLLLEPSRSNIVTYSEDTTTWGKNETPVVTLNNGIAPDGTQSSDKAVVNSISEGLFNFSAGTVTSGTTYTTSIFIKHISGIQTIRFGFAGTGFGGDNNNVFNIVNGTIVSSVANSTNQIINYGNGWFRLICTKAATATNTGGFILYGNVNAEIQYNVWGAQLEAGYLTSYIPTQGSAVTRSAETGVDCLLPNGTIIDNSTATVYFEFEALADDASDRWISFEEVGTATDNQFEIRLAAAFDLIQIVTRSSGGGQDVTMSETLTDITANNKIALNYNGLNWKLAVNGTITDTATAARLFNDNIEKIKFSRQNNTNHFYGKVKDLRVYNTALTDAELIALTS